MNAHGQSAFDAVERLPGSLREILYFLNSKPMLEFLEALTVFKGIIPILIMLVRTASN